MSNITETLHSFKIPSPKNRFHRRSFYGLHRRFKEPVEEWFKRIENDVNLCGFDKFTEYLLLDKFFSELDDGEIAAIRSERQTWSLKQLHQYLRTENIRGTESSQPNGAADGKNEMNTVNERDESDPFITIQSVDVAMKMEFEDSEAADIDSASEDDDDDDDDDSESQSNVVNDDDEEEQILACGKCDMRFALISQLEVHVEKCDKSFEVDQSPALKTRKKSIPNKKIEESRNERLRKSTTSAEIQQILKKRSHICDICNKGLHSSSNLKKHRLTHFNIKPFACDLCDLKVTTLHSLNRHKNNIHKLEIH